MNKRLFKLVLPVLLFLNSNVLGAQRGARAAVAAVSALRGGAPRAYTASRKAVPMAAVAAARPLNLATPAAGYASLVRPAASTVKPVLIPYASMLPAVLKAGLAGINPGAVRFYNRDRLRDKADESSRVKKIVNAELVGWSQRVVRKAVISNPDELEDIIDDNLSSGGTHTKMVDTLKKLVAKSPGFSEVVAELIAAGVITATQDDFIEAFVSIRHCGNLVIDVLKKLDNECASDKLVALLNILYSVEEHEAMYEGKVDDEKLQKHFFEQMGSSLEKVSDWDQPSTTSFMNVLIKMGRAHAFHPADLQALVRALNVDHVETFLVKVGANSDNLQFLTFLDGNSMARVFKRVFPDLCTAPICDWKMERAIRFINVMWGCLTNNVKKYEEYFGVKDNREFINFLNQLPEMYEWMLENGCVGTGGYRLPDTDEKESMLVRSLFVNAAKVARPDTLTEMGLSRYKGTLTLEHLKTVLDSVDIKLIIEHFCDFEYSDFTHCYENKYFSVCPGGGARGISSFFEVFGEGKVHEVLDREKRLFGEYITFYHGQVGFYGYQIDMRRLLGNELAKAGYVRPMPKDFVPIQSCQASYTTDDKSRKSLLVDAEVEQVELMEANHHDKYGRRPFNLLSVNSCLFGNLFNSGSCTTDYILSERNVRPINTDFYTNVFKDLGVPEHIYNKYAAEVDILMDKYQNCYGASLLQIAVPKEKVSDWVYLAKSGARKVSHIHDGVEIDCVTKFVDCTVDKVEGFESGIDLASECAMPLTAASILNPDSGVKVFDYKVEKNADKVADYQARMSDLVSRIAADVVLHKKEQAGALSRARVSADVRMVAVEAVAMDAAIA